MLFRESDSVLNSGTPDVRFEMDSVLDSGTPDVIKFEMLVNSDSVLHPGSQPFCSNSLCGVVLEVVRL